jgi:hypothetical protein
MAGELCVSGVSDLVRLDLLPKGPKNGFGHNPQLMEDFP